MAFIKDVLIRGDKGQARVTILIDSGATQSFIARRVADAVASIRPLPNPQPFLLASGEEYLVHDAAEIGLEVAGRTFSARYLVQDGDNLMDLILGEDQLKEQGLTLDYARGVLCPIQPVTAGGPSALQKETPMNEMLMRIFARLNMQAPEALTDDDAIAMIVQRCTGMAAPMIASEPILTALQCDKDATEADVVGKILALQKPGNVVPIETHNAALGELATLKADKALSDAIVEGKLTPAEKPWGQEVIEKQGLATFAAMVKARPRQTPVGLTLPKEPEKPPATLAAAREDDLQAAINKQLGLDAATFSKYAQ